MIAQPDLPGVPGFGGLRKTGLELGLPLELELEPELELGAGVVE